MDGEISDGQVYLVSVAEVLLTTLYGAYGVTATQHTVDVLLRVRNPLGSPILFSRILQPFLQTSWLSSASLDTPVIRGVSILPGCLSKHSQNVKSTGSPFLLVSWVLTKMDLTGVPFSIIGTPIKCYLYGCSLVIALPVTNSVKRTFI